jgi:hypothetical protein
MRIAVFRTVSEEAGVTTQQTSADTLSVGSTQNPAEMEQPIATGRISARLSHNVYAVVLDDVSLSEVLEVGSRVFITSLPGSAASNPPTNSTTGIPTSVAGGVAGRFHTNNIVGPASSAVAAPNQELLAGLVAKVNGNGTFSILLDNDQFEHAVSRCRIVLSEGRSRFLNNEAYHGVLNWVRNAGVDRRSDQESTSTILYHRGWRSNKLYLLEAADVQCLCHLNKSVRMSLLEKADWEREHHRQKRELSKEKLKEEEWTYVMTKYSGVLSACVAVLGVMSVFTWNFKNWRKQQRSYQLEIAVAALEKSVKRPQGMRVVRAEEEEKLRKVLRRMDLTHPRVVVLVGPEGSGKSNLLKSAASKEKLPCVYVEIRGGSGSAASSEDPLKTLVKSLGVQNIEACGDLLDFIEEACIAARHKSKLGGRAPLICFKLRDSAKQGIKRVYSEAVSLGCDRCCCHIMIECNVEAMHVRDASLPRCDFVYVPNFSPAEAIAYANHLVEPMDMLPFVEVCGTNSTDLDELLSAVLQREIPARDYTASKLHRAMHHLQLLWARSPKVQHLLTLVASEPFDVGMADEKKLVAQLFSECLSAKPSNTVSNSSTSDPLGVRAAMTVSNALAAAAAPSLPASMRGSINPTAATRVMHIQDSTKIDGSSPSSNISSNYEHGGTGYYDVGEELRDLVYFNPILEAWMFQSKLYHTAAVSWAKAYSEVCAHPEGDEPSAPHVSARGDPMQTFDIIAHEVEIHQPQAREHLHTLSSTASSGQGGHKVPSYLDECGTFVEEGSTISMKQWVQGTAALVGAALVYLPVVFL